MEYADLSPADVYESFTHLRRHLIKRFEEQHDDQEEVARREQWQEVRSEELDQNVLGSLQLTVDDIDRQMDEASAAHLAFAAQFDDREPLVQSDPGFGLHAMPQPNTGSAFPYAVGRIATTTDQLDGFDGEVTGNPDAWKLSSHETRQGLELIRRGHGSGLVSIWWPEYTPTYVQELHWCFLHMPFGDGEWSCSATPWFHGEYYVWSDDGPFSSTYARADLGASITLIPFGSPHPLVHLAQSADEKVLGIGGSNVGSWRQDHWWAHLPELTPHASQRQKPHWIVVSAWGAVAVRGASVAQLRFDNGLSQSGPYEDGSYKINKWGVYCHTAKIHW
jgi:hypothetical protein